MSNCDIHLSMGTNPTRIILSYVKGQTFHIYKIDYKEVISIDDINPRLYLYK